MVTQISVGPKLSYTETTYPSNIATLPPECPNIPPQKTQHPEPSNKCLPKIASQHTQIGASKHPPRIGASEHHQPAHHQIDPTYP